MKPLRRITASAIVVVMLLMVAGCVRQFSSSKQPPMSGESSSVTDPTEKPVVSPPGQQPTSALSGINIVEAYYEGGRTITVIEPGQIIETWAEAVVLSLHGRSPFYVDDLMARIKTVPSEAGAGITVQTEHTAPWAQMKVSLGPQQSEVKVTISAKPATNMGKAFDQDWSIIIRRVEPRKISVSCAEHPDLQFPGAYGVHTGTKTLTVTFSHPVETEQVTRQLYQMRSTTDVTWANDRQVTLSLPLSHAGDTLDLFGSQFQDNRGIPFAASTFILQAVDPIPIKAITGLNSEVTVTSLDTLTHSAVLSPDGGTLIYTKADVNGAGERDTGGSVWLLDMASKATTPLLTGIRLASSSMSAYWYPDSERFWLVSGGGLWLNDGAYLYDRHGQLITTVAVPTLKEGYHARGSALSLTGEMLAICLADVAQVSGSEQLVPITVRFYSNSGAMVKEYTKVAWQPYYWKGPERYLCAFSYNGDKLYLRGRVQHEENWIAGILSIDVMQDRINMSSDFPNPYDSPTGEPLVREGRERDYLLPSPNHNKYLVLTDYGLAENSQSSPSPQSYSVINHRGEVLQTICTDAQPSAWSPDGSRIAFQEAKGDSIRLLVYDLATSVMSVWLESGADIVAGWGPDGIIILERDL